MNLRNIVTFNAAVICALALILSLESKPSSEASAAPQDARSAYSWKSREDSSETSLQATAPRASFSSSNAQGMPSLEKVNVTFDGKTLFSDRLPSNQSRFAGKIAALTSKNQFVFLHNGS